MMLEVLISILLLSLGILGIVALQTTMGSNLSDARYRAEAALLGEQLIGTMWGDIPNLGAYQINQIDLGNPPAVDCTSYTTTTTSNTALSSWLGTQNASPPDPGTVFGLLPNGRASVSVIADPNSPDNGLVSITLCWQGPKEDPNTWHQYSTATQIKV